MSEELIKIAAEIKKSQADIAATLKNYFARDLKGEEAYGIGQGGVLKQLMVCQKGASKMQIIPGGGSGVQVLDFVNAPVNIQRWVLSVDADSAGTGHVHSCFADFSNDPLFRDIPAFNTADVMAGTQQNIGNTGPGFSIIMPKTTMAFLSLSTFSASFTWFLDIPCALKCARIRASSGGNSFAKLLMSLTAMGS